MLAYNALTTIEDTKDFLSISPDDDSYNSYLEKLINAASAWIESKTARRFGLKRRTERQPGSGRQTLIVNHYPIRIIHQIKDIDQKYWLDSEKYHFDPERNVGQIHLDTGWTKRGYYTGLVPDYKFSKSYLQVDYTAGYILPKDVTEESDLEWILPHDLQLLVWNMADRFKAISENGAAGLSSFSIADVSWSFDKEAPADWLDILANYSRLL